MAKSTIDILLRIRGQKQFKAQVGAAAAQLEAMGVAGAGAMGKFASQSGKLKSIGRDLTTKLTLPMVAAGGVAVKAASDWESSFAGVRKTVDATESQFAGLESGIRQMALEIPVSADEIAGIAESAGQLGIETENILGFSRVMADLGVATNLSSEEAATQLARLANITQMPQDQFDRLGSTVVALGNNMATTESDIVSMGMRIAGAGNQVGMSEAEIMSFAAGLSSVGIAAEAGGTAISQSFLKMNTAVLDGGKDLAGFADVAGVSGEKFRRMFKDDAAGAMTVFMEGLQGIKKSGGNVSSVLKDLGLSGIRVQDMMMRGAGAGDLLREALEIGNDAWAENSALGKEAEERYKTFASQLKVLKNHLKDVAIMFGEKLLPPLTDFVKGLGPKIQGFFKFFGNLPGPVQKLALGFAALLAAVGPVMWVLGGVAGVLGKFLIIATKLIPVLKGLAWVTKVWGVFLLTNPIFLVVAGIVALGAAFVLAYQKIGWFRDAVDAAFGWIVTAASAVANAVANSVGSIGNTFKGMRDRVVGIMRGLVNFLRRHWKLVLAVAAGPLGGLVALTVTLFNKIGFGGKNATEMVKRAFNALVKFFGSIPGRIAGAASGMWNFLKDGLKSALNWVIDKINWVLQKIGSIKINIPSVKIPGLGRVGGGSIGIPVPPDIPRLATGGTVVQSGVTLVGEQGPELLSLPAAASVVPLNRETIREVAGGGRQVIEVPVYLDGREIARAFSDRLSDAAAAA